VDKIYVENCSPKAENEETKWKTEEYIGGKVFPSTGLGGP
jgi:hypothetical protein